MNNSKNVLRYMFGKGSISNLKSILDTRAEGDNYVVYFIDEYFKQKSFFARSLN